MKRAEVDALDSRYSELCKSREAWNQVVNERRLETIELRLVRETVSLKEEKLLLKEMAQLKQKRAQCTEQAPMSSHSPQADADSKIALINEECAEVGGCLLQESDISCL